MLFYADFYTFLKTKKKLMILLYSRKNKINIPKNINGGVSYTFGLKKMLDITKNIENDGF